MILFSLECVPMIAEAQGEGCYWTVFKTRTSREWSGQSLQFALKAFLPADVDVDIEAWLIRQWWEENELPIFEGFYGNAPQ